MLGGEDGCRAGRRMATDRRRMALVERLAKLRALSPRDRAFFVGSWLLAGPVTAALAIGGFARATRALKRLPRLVERDAPVDVARDEELVRRAFAWSLARWSVKGGGCLPRSMVQYALHTLAGEPVRLVVGVPPHAPRDPESFEAHSWVEAVGRPRPDVTHAVLFELAQR